MTEHCERCGRFVGADALEGVDWSRGSIGLDGDWPYTGVFYCASGRGCNKESEPLAQTLPYVKPEQEKSPQAPPNLLSF